MVFWLGVLVGFTNGFGAGVVLALFLCEKRVLRAMDRARGIIKQPEE